MRGKRSGRGDAARSPRPVASPGLVDAFVKRQGEVPQGPEILEARRLVEQPDRRPARPAVLLVIDLVVQEAVKERVGPALGRESARPSAARPTRTLAGTTPERPGRPSSRPCSFPPSGWASSRARGDRSTRPEPPCAAGSRTPSRPAAARTGGPRRSSRAAVPCHPSAGRSRPGCGRSGCTASGSRPSGADGPST